MEAEEPVKEEEGPEWEESAEGQGEVVVEEEPAEEVKGGVKREEIGAPPGLGGQGLVDELQAMSPAQKKARLQLLQLTKPCLGHIG